MRVFKEYARYYDLLYRDKDYDGEARYIDGHIRAHCPGCEHILDLGCGTGNHAISLAKIGYDVTGIDLSEINVATAVAKLETIGGMRRKVRFHKDDIRGVRFGKTYDAVISLFHVMSYQTTNRDLDAAFQTAAAHVRPGGVFIFDFWYGPGVLTDPPAPRLKTVRDGGIFVYRIAEPKMFPLENIVEIDYRILVRDEAHGTIHELQEIHRMRYLFMPEVQRLLSVNGFDGVACEEWLSGETPQLKTWNLCCIGIKRNE